MADSGDSTRRDFLTGRSVSKALRARGEELADALTGSEEGRTPPAAGETVRLETRAMACPWSVVLNPGPPRQVMSASDALDLVHDCEDLLTVYRDSSPVSKLNQLAASSPQCVNETLFEFLIRCQEIFRQTAGAFDPASGAMIQLWKQARQENRIPDQEEIDAAQRASGFHHVHLDQASQTVFFDAPGVLLDFGAIGKGEAIDLAAAHLRREEITDFLVHGGHSSLFAQGRHADHSGWPVGIKNPLFTDRRYATLLLQNEALSTSGSNIQYFRHGGERYGHILDPRTGWPSRNLLSVSVIASNAALSDALSTAFYVMGLEPAVEFCSRHEQVGAILVPHPASGRSLAPVVVNFPQDRLFWEK